MMNIQTQNKVATNGHSKVEGSEGCRSVLLVDDEARIINALFRLLHENYDVHRTESPAEALEMLQSDEFALVISDQRMPDMLGTELCVRASEIAPQTKRVILTGYSDMKAALDAINKGSVYRFMLKPWKDSEMSDLVEEAVQHYNLAAENRRLSALTVRQNLELQQLNRRLEDFNGKLQEKVFERTREISELNEKVTCFFRGSIDLLARLSAMHSQVLGNHGRRVAELAIEIGRERGLSDRELADLEIASTLHDIGKIGMDARVVATETSQRTDHEDALLRTHPVEGAGLIARIPGLRDVATLVRHHHEAFGGGGYPDRIEGEAIPLGSRIIAVADAFDNYLNMRSRYTVAEANAALAHVREGSGSRFDPEIVRALARLIEGEGMDVPDSDEMEVGLRELRTGMVIARDLVTIGGTILLKQGGVVSASLLPEIFEHTASDPIAEGPFVYRNFPPRKRAV